MDADLGPLPVPTSDLEQRAKDEMDGAGYRHWMTCRALGVCPACQQTVAEGEKLRRGIHLTCYALTYKYAREGDWSLEERLRSGRIDPSDRGRHPITAEARRLRRT